MRPERFLDYTLDLLKNTPGVARVQTLQDLGETKYPYAVAVTTEKGETRWQIIGQLPPGSRHEDPDTPVNGTPPPAGEPPRPGDDAETWMAAAIAQAECPEIERIERWSPRQGNRADHIGMTLYFHDSSKVFLRAL
jgi:hypothetical protein